MEIADDVYVFPQELGSDEINPSGVETENGLILFDVGLSGKVDKLKEQLEKHGFGLSDVEKIVLTHQDPDHAGALSEVLEKTDAVVFAHRDDAPAIDGRQDPIKAEERYPAVEVDVELSGGEVFNTDAGKVSVHTTPGHTPGHISVLVEEKGLLIAADSTVAEDGELLGPDEDFTPELDEAYESLYYLSTLDFEETLCYHGGFVEEGADKISKIFQEYSKNLQGFEKKQVEKVAFLRRELDTEKVGLSRFQLEAGEKHGARENPDAGHRHTRQEEIYLFLKGSGSMKVGEKEFEYSEGTAVKVQPYCFRRIDAEEDTDFVVAGAPLTEDEAEYQDIW